MRVDYHLHTRFSYDCATPPEAVLERALKAGLGCLCVTDHDTIEGALELERIRSLDMQIVVGCEFVTEDGSQIIGLDLKDMITAKRIPELLEKIKLQGALVLLPHPFRRGSGVFRREMRRSEGFVREVLAFTDMVECFNGRDTYENNRRNHLFATRCGVPGVAGSDAHTAAEIGSVFVEYEDDDCVHGVSPRRIYFPDQVPHKESPAKRRLMELYHRHRASLPAIVDTAYHASRKRLKSDLPAGAGRAARMQYELPRAPSTPEGHGAG